MASSTISLSISKGPKKGQTHVGLPGKLIGIGRVVKGNTIAIKDMSISQKHLTVSFIPEIAHWVITDLGSSNGTQVNGVLISPEIPTPLADGDEIMLGEKTSITVNISVPVPESSALPNLGRSLRPRKGVISKEKCHELLNEPERKKPIAEKKERKGRWSTNVLRNEATVEPVLKEEVVVISSPECVPDARKEMELDNMDNMTLREWFDRVEEYLPKQINKVAEEIIAKLRENAELREKAL